jgi:cytochrome c peroxidase
VATRARFLFGAFVVAALAGATASACSDSSFEAPAGPTADTKGTAARSLSPLPAVPPDQTNAVADSAPAAALGQMLFFDKSFSGAIAIGDDGVNGGLGAMGESGKVSCASCHIGAALDDRRSKPGNVSLGTDYGTRRALPLVNASFYNWANWGGRFDSQWSLPLAVAENAKIMNGTRLQIVHAIYAKYKADYEAIFPALDPRLEPSHPSAAAFPPKGKPKKALADPDGPWELMAGSDRTIVNTIYANYGKAIAAYLRLLVSRESPFDKYAAGDKSAISDAADRGLSVFAGKGQCIACHNGPHFEDGQFHALGVPSPDLGRYNDVADLLGSPFNSNGAFSANVTTGKLTGLAKSDAQRGQFRTKSLRGVAVAGPYMHAGQLATLEDVVAFYKKGGGELAADAGIVKDAKLHVLDLTPQESADLVDFLKTLTGAPLPPALTVDTSKP